MRVSSAYFLAFCRARDEATGPRIGLTAPRALGNAVARNRIKRRMRETVRQQLWKLAPQWDIVFNPRRSVLEAPMPELLREVDKVFRRCKAS